MPATKIYRASQRIASENKSCPSCSQRIRVGQPVVFLTPTSGDDQTRAKAVAHHKGCSLHRI